MGVPSLRDTRLVIICIWKEARGSNGLLKGTRMMSWSASRLLEDLTQSDLATGLVSLLCFNFLCFFTGGSKCNWTLVKSWRRQNQVSWLCLWGNQSFSFWRGQSYPDSQPCSIWKHWWGSGTEFSSHSQGKRTRDSRTLSSDSFLKEQRRTKPSPTFQLFS